ncbi:MAG: hypothetical protein AAFW70_15505 [Cyanobacteria bacterium J06635_10]
MLAIKADSLKENSALREKVVDKINKGKKVTFKFPSMEDMLDF